MSPLRSIALLVLLLVALPACKVQTDLNASCKLVKANPDGGKAPVSVREHELRLPDGGTGGKDFIGVGSTDCEELFCVRDSSWPADAGDDMDAEAYGYCSRQCLIGEECPSYEEALDEGPNKLGCRGLLLSEETLAVLQEEFPGIAKPDFCARAPAVTNE